MLPADFVPEIVDVCFIIAILVVMHAWGVPPKTKTVSAGCPKQPSETVCHQVSHIFAFSRSSDFRIIPNVAPFPCDSPVRAITPVGEVSLLPHPVPDYSDGIVTELHRVPRC